MAVSPATELLLIRHGQTPWNLARRWQGHADPGLTELGRAQAQRVARDLAALEERPWSRVVSSDLARAERTATEVARALQLPLESDPRLRELDVGRWSGLVFAEIEAIDRESLYAFEAGEAEIRPGGGETRPEMRARALDCIRDLDTRYRGESLIVVAHLGVIRALVPGKEPANGERISVTAEAVLAGSASARPSPPSSGRKANQSSAL